MPSSNTSPPSSALRPRARLLRILGEELISSEIIAVIELVKNSYDADATRVMIRFVGPLEPGKGRIEVIDNGHGMELETVYLFSVLALTVTVDGPLVRARAKGHGLAASQ